VMEGWAIKHCAAAAVMEPVSTAATKYPNDFKSNYFSLCVYFKLQG